MKKNFNNNYSKKISSLEKIKKILGKRPRKKKVILCHGNFDVVHPGHVRHLIYAKSKADLLIEASQQISIFKKVYIDHLYLKIYELRI